MKRSTAEREARKEKRAHGHADSCHRCRTYEPLHIGRERRASKGHLRPRLIIDTMMCLNCGAEWKEVWQPGKGTEHLKENE